MKDLVLGKLAQCLCVSLMLVHAMMTSCRVTQVTLEGERTAELTEEDKRQWNLNKSLAAGGRCAWF